MSSLLPSGQSVFINCPFDPEYRPLFRALVFTILSMGLTPRYAIERANSAEQRNLKILQLIAESNFGIHDLSRCKAKKKGDFYRMNMPLELGYDLGLKHKGGKAFARKCILILEEIQYSVQRSASDLAGCDCEAHHNDPPTLMTKVRTWLVTEAGAPRIAPTAIWVAYLKFNDWLDEKLQRSGWGPKDIQDIDMNELRDEMIRWLKKNPLKP